MVGKILTAGRETWRIATGSDGLRAVVRRTGYGASVELSDGRGAAFWAYAVAGPVEKAAVAWARAAGAVFVELNS